MLTLEEVKDWLKSQDDALKDCIAVGGIDGDKEKYVGIYPLGPAGDAQRICIGGAEQTRYQVCRISVLLHWTENAVTAENKAVELYNRFYGLSHVSMGKTGVISADPGPGPIPVGKDTNGICEYVIQIKFRYERNER